MEPENKLKYPDVYTLFWLGSLVFLNNSITKCSKTRMYTLYFDYSYNSKNPIDIIFAKVLVEYMMLLNQTNIKAVIIARFAVIVLRTDSSVRGGYGFDTHIVSA